MSQARKVVPFPKPVAPRRAEELGFVPAALEIVERPPSPTGRAIGLTIVIVAIAAVVWASLSWVDIIATAPGSIIPSGRSKVVQSLAISVVQSIHVHDGDHVKAGAVLIELDPTLELAERRHAQGDLAAAQLDALRLRATLDGGVFVPTAVNGADPALAASESQLLSDQLAEQTAKLATLDRQRTQKEAERGTALATIGKLRAMIPILQEQVDMRKLLFDHQTGSKLVYLQTLQSLVEQQQDLAVAQSRYRETDAAVAAIVELRRQTIEEFRRTRLDELTKAETKVAEFTQDLVKADDRARLQKITAPIDGVVQQLAVHTEGGIVTPAESLMVIVPEDRHIEIRARISNRDIGFVHPGQRAEIKVDTFPYTKYGLLHGRVESVSSDAVTSDDRADKNEEKSAAISADSADPSAKEAVYEARVSLERTQLNVDGESVQLAPGMAVTVEVKTGTRRIISYLLSPLLRYAHESMRER